MSDFEIRGSLVVDGKGVTKLSGDINKLQSEFKKLAGAQVVGGPLRKHYKDIREELARMSIEAQKTGRALVGFKAVASSTKEGGFRIIPQYISLAHANAIKLRREQERLNAALRESIRLQQRYGSWYAKQVDIEIKNKKGKQEAYGSWYAKQVDKEINDKRKKEEHYGSWYAKQIEKQKREEERIKKQQERDAARSAFQKEAERKNKWRAITATAGFAGLNLASIISASTDSLNVRGIFGSTFQKIFGDVGGLLGQTFGTIFSEMGNVIGKTVETIADTVLSVFRNTFKGLAQIFTGFSTGLISVMFTPWSMVIGLISGILGSIVTIISGVMDQIAYIVKNVIEIIGSIIRIGLTIITSIFKSIGEVLTKIWKGLWEGLKGIAQMGMDAISYVVDKGTNFISTGFKDMVQAQKDAAKGFAQVADLSIYTGKSFLQGTADVEKMTDALRRNYGLTQEQAASPVYFTLSSGFRDIADAGKILNSTLKLSSIAQEDTAEVTRTTIALLNAYGKTADDVDSVTKILWGGVALGNFELGELTQGLQTTISSAAALNLPLEQLVGAMSAMSRAGVRAHMAGAGMNRMLEAATIPGSTAAKTYEKLGIRVNEFREGLIDLPSFLEDVANKLPEQKLREIFPTVQARRAFLALTRNAERFRDIVRESAQAGEMMNEAFDKSKNTWYFMINSLTQTWQTFRKSIISSLATSFGPIFKQLGEMFTNTFSKIESFDWKSIGDMLANAFVKLLDIFAGLPQFLKDLFGIKMEFKGIGDYLKTTLKTVLDSITDPKNWEEFFKSIASGLVGLKMVFDIIKESFLDVEKLKTNFSIIFDGLSQSIKSIGVLIVSILSEAFKFVINIFNVLFREKVVALGQTLTDTILKSLEPIFEKMSIGIQKAMSDLPGELGGYLSPIRTVLDSLTDVTRMRNNPLENVNNKQVRETISMFDRGDMKSLLLKHAVILGYTQDEDYKKLHSILVLLSNHNKEYVELTKKSVDYLKQFDVKGTIKPHFKSGVVGDGPMYKKSELETVITKGMEYIRKGVSHSRTYEQLMMDDKVIESFKQKLKLPDDQLTTQEMSIKQTLIEQQKVDKRKQFEDKYNEDMRNVMKNLGEAVFEFSDSQRRIVGDMFGKLSSSNPSAIKEYNKRIEEIKNNKSSISEKFKEMVDGMKEIFGEPLKQIADNTGKMVEKEKSGKAVTAIDMIKWVKPGMLQSEMARLQKENPGISVSPIGDIKTGKGSYSGIRMQGALQNKNQDRTGQGLFGLDMMNYTPFGPEIMNPVDFKTQEEMNRIKKDKLYGTQKTDESVNHLKEISRKLTDLINSTRKVENNTGVQIDKTDEVKETIRPVQNVVWSLL